MSLIDNTISYLPLSIKTWDPFVELFGDKGACGGCWCMTMRLKTSEYEKNKGEGNKKVMHEMVKHGKPLGILAFEGTQAIGWCSISPREQYKRLNNSRILRAVDDQPVWSIVCFFIRRGFRGQRLSLELIKAAINYAHQHGAQIIEAYPQIPKKVKIPEVFAYTGLASTFRKAGFKEVLRRSETRPIMRYVY